MMRYGVVAIGRNEGERLKRCLDSLSTATAIVYVDSGSTDGSAQKARENGVDVIELDMSAGFTAARARNAGFKHLMEIAPDLRNIQFVDGDSKLSEGWLEQAALFLESHANIGVACGRLRERDPNLSIYTWLCELEWDGPIGEIRSCGGINMVRAEAFKAVGGYREDVMAGEEAELCVRLRAAGWRAWRLDTEMATHDSAMTRFSQWWRRALRTGYAFGQGAYLHRTSSESLFLWESRRAWIWGIWLPLACLVAGLTLGPWGWATWLIYPMQLLRQVVRNPGTLGQRATLALFHLLARFPEVLGQIRFIRDRWLGRPGRLIEHK